MNGAGSGRGSGVMRQEEDDGMSAEIGPEKRITPSEVLMGALEGIDDCTEVMIIRVNAEGSIKWHTSTDCIHKKLGMVEAVRQWIIKGMMET